MYRLRPPPSSFPVDVPAPSILSKPPNTAPSSVAPTKAPSPTQRIVLDRQGILDHIVCPKKFFQMRALPILQPPSLASRVQKQSTSTSQCVRMQDSMEFRELCFAWDRVTVHKNAVYVRESDFEQAHVRTSDVINNYFESTYSKLGSGAPPLMLHRPAIRALLSAGDDAAEIQGKRVIELRGRPAILHFYPKFNEWRFYHPTAVTDPLSDKFRAEHLLHSMLFDMYVLQEWQKTNHLLSPLAKQLLTCIASTPASLARSRTTSSDARATQSLHINALKSSVLSIRSYIAGPLTLQHHDTYSLSQFVAKTCMSELAAKAEGRKATPDTNENEVGDNGGSWNLGVGLAAMEQHTKLACETLRGAVNERQRKIWTAMSSPGSTGSVSPDFSALVSSVCKKDLVDCPLYAPGKCLPPLMDENNIDRGIDWTFNMPGFNTDKKVALWTADIHTFDQIQKESEEGTLKKGAKPLVKLTPPQLRYIEARRANSPRVNPGAIQAWMQSIKYPAFFLDFEAVQFALPPFDQCKPYQAIPFQFSLDVFHNDVLTETPTHHEFLFLEEPGCSPYDDPRSLCIAKLMAAIRQERAVARKKYEASPQSGGNDSGDSIEPPHVRGKAKKLLQGTSKGLYRSQERKIQLNPWDGIIVSHFAAFEKSVLQKAANHLPQFKDEISNFVFLDTIDLVKNGITHPAAKGSTSLKKLVPALLGKNEQYATFDSLSSTGDDGGEAADGSVAAALYRLWRQRGALDVSMVEEMQIVKAEAERLGWSRVRKQLMQYCHADTRNMYLIIRAIKDLANTVVARGDRLDGEGWSIPPSARGDAASPPKRAATSSKRRGKTTAAKR